MGSLSALPALDIKQQPQSDLLEKYAQLQQLRAGQQQMDIRAQQAPLQQQQLEQGVQQGGLDIQKQQTALKNQQALTQAYKTWDGKNYDDLAHLALQNGATADAVQALQQHGLALKKTASDIAESDAKTGSDNATTLGKQLDQAAGALTGILSAPPEQQGQLLVTTAQQLAQQKRPDGTPLLDAQHLQMAQQLAQQGPQAIATQVPIFAKSLTALSAQLEAAQKASQVRSENATAGEKEMNIARGGSTDVDKFESDYLKSNNLPDTPSNRMAAFKEYTNQTKIAPAQVRASTFLQMPQAVFDPASGQNVYTTRAGAIGKEAPSSADALAAKGSVQADVGSLKNLQKNFDQVSAFESTANKNLDLYLNKLSQIPDLGVKFANVPMRMINDKMIGTANYQAMKAAQQTAAAETAKVLSSANASGVLSDTQKKEAEDMLSGNLSYAAAQKVVQTLKQDFANRHQSYQDQIGLIQQRIKPGSAQQPAATGQPKVGDVKTFPNGKKGVWDGQGYVAQ